MHDNKSEFNNSDEQYNEKSYIKNYRTFRKSGLGICDSFFAAVYIILCSKHIKHYHKSVSDYPFIIRLLSKAPFAIRSFFEKIKKIFEGFWRKDTGITKLKKRRHFWRKNYLLIISAIVFVIGSSYVFIKAKMPVVLYAQVNGVLIGKVDDRTAMQSAINELEQNVTKILGADFKFPYKVTYTFESEFAAKLSEKKELTDNLYSMLREYITTASGLYVDNALVAVAANRDDIDKVLEKILDEQQKPKEGEICFLNEISVLEQAYPTKSISDRKKIEEIVRTLLIPIEERQSGNAGISPISQKVIVNDTDTAIIGLAGDVEYHTKESNKYTDNLQNLSDVALVIATKKNETYNEQINYSIRYAENKKLYTTSTRVESAGSAGNRQVNADVYYVDGVKSKVKVISSYVTKSPVDRIINVGIKVLPEDLGVTTIKGRFILPHDGIVTSKFGVREKNDTHKGWDIAGNTGDYVYAAASGKVVTVFGRKVKQTIFAGRSYTGYGNVIVLDHGNNWYTLYAHLSDTEVYLGQEVKQGELIGYVGNTGNSQGSHLHFEIMNGQTKVDPAKGYFYDGKYTIYDDYSNFENEYIN